jgi:hypothetical protein
MFVRYRIHMIQQVKNLVAVCDWRLFMCDAAQAWIITRGGMVLLT